MHTPFSYARHCAVQNKPVDSLKRICLGKLNLTVKKSFIKDFDATLVLIAAVFRMPCSKGNDGVMRTWPQDPHLLP
jgi:hypothetical protein